MKKLIFIPLVLLSTNAWAIISCSPITSGSSATDATSYNTASITPNANTLILFDVVSHITSGPPVEPTLSGNGLTWVSVASNTATSANEKRLTRFRAMGSSPTAGAITISFGAETQLWSAWLVSQCSGVDTSGIDGAGAVVQTVKTTGTGFANSVIITLATFSRDGNVGHGVKSHFTNEATTPGTGFLELAEANIDNGGGSSQSGNQIEWKENDNTVDWSWVTSSRNFGIASELQLAPTTLNAGTYEASTIN